MILGSSRPRLGSGSGGGSFEKSGPGAKLLGLSPLVSLGRFYAAIMASIRRQARPKATNQPRYARDAFRVMSDSPARSEDQDEPSTSNARGTVVTTPTSRSVQPTALRWDADRRSASRRPI